MSMDIKADKKIQKTDAADEKVSKRCGFLYDENGRKKDKKFIAVELIPPFNTDDEKLLESAHYLKNAGVDVLTFPDSPSGRTKSRFCPYGSKSLQGNRYRCNASCMLS